MYLPSHQKFARDEQELKLRILSYIVVLECYMQLIKIHKSSTKTSDVRFSNVFPYFYRCNLPKKSSALLSISNYNSCKCHKQQFDHFCSHLLRDIIDGWKQDTSLQMDCIECATKLTSQLIIIHNIQNQAIQAKIIT